MFYDMPIFKRYGRAVVLPVKNIMSSPPVTIGGESDLRDAVNIMWERRIGSVIVVDNSGRLVGLVTERDILYAAYKGLLCRSMKVSEIMSRNVITAKPDEDVATAIERMRQANIRHLPVIDEEGKPVGMLTIRDVMDTAALFMKIISRLE